MLYLLFAIYLFAFCLLIRRIPFVRKTGLSNAAITIFFLVKVAVSVIVTFVYLNYTKDSDIEVFHNFGLLEQNLLLTDPKEWVQNFFRAGYSTGYAGFFASKNSYWNNLSPNIIIKMLSLFNFISAKNLYINTLFFNFLVFLAPAALYRVFIHAFSPWRPALAFCLFLLPSALIYTSIVHKDGLAFLAISMVIYHFYFSLQRVFSLKSAIVALFFLLLVLALRNYVFLALLPAVFCWLMAAKRPRTAFFIFGGVYALLTIVIFTSPWLLPIDLMKVLTTRREVFNEISIDASTVLSANSLEPTFSSFLAHLPRAVGNTFFRPQIFESISLLYLPFTIEVVIFELGILLVIFFKKQNDRGRPLSLFLIFFCTSVLLIVGYTIPVLGAIVRYRSIYEVILMSLMASEIDWRRLARMY